MDRLREDISDLKLHFKQVFRCFIVVVVVAVVVVVVVVVVMMS